MDAAGLGIQRGMQKKRAVSVVLEAMTRSAARGEGAERGGPNRRGRVNDPRLAALSGSQPRASSFAGGYLLSPEPELIETGREPQFASNESNH